MDCSPPGSSVHGIFQARILERIAISFYRGEGNLSNPGMEPTSPARAGFFTTMLPGKPWSRCLVWHNCVNTVWPECPSSIALRFVFNSVPITTGLMIRRDSCLSLNIPSNVAWTASLGNYLILTILAAQVTQRWRICLPMQETQVQSLGQEEPLEEEMATHCSILAWRIPWTEEPGGLQSMGS